MTELEDVLRREVARASRYREVFSLVLVEVSPQADLVGRVRDGVRVCDAALAAGPDRVAVVLPETPLQGALEVARRLSATLGQGPGSGPSQGPAVGVATFPAASVADAGSLLAAAEAALSRARARGGVAI